MMRGLWKVARILPIVGTAVFYRNSISLQENAEEMEEAFLVDEPLINKQREVPLLQQERQTVQNTEENTKEQVIRDEQKEGNLPNNQSVQNQTAQAITQKQTVQNIPQTHSQPQKSLDEQQTNEQSVEQEAPTVTIQQLQNNQVLVGSNCPKDLLHYFQLVNIPIIHSPLISSVTVKNSRGDIYQFDPKQQSVQTDKKQLLANFINPPHNISTIQQAKQLLSLLQEQDFAVLAYIPEADFYKQLMNKLIRSEYDEFSKRRQVDLESVEKKFVEKAYKSSSNRDCYGIVRNQEVAEYLKMNHFAIGQPYLLSKGQPGDCNLKVPQGKYKIMQTYKHPLYIKNNQKNQHQIDINRLTHRPVNRIDSQAELYNKIRQMQISNDKRKILLFYTAQNKEQFHRKTEEVLEKVALIQQQDIVVIKCSNLEAMRRVLTVEPDPFATIRLIDPHTAQKPLFGTQPVRPIFSRRKYKGPFQLESLCRFAQSNQGEEYYENKNKLSSIKPIHPNELAGSNNTVVLIEKQGCDGCKYVGESMDELKKIIKGLRNGGRPAKQLTYRYGITNANLLERMTLRKYSIYNDNPDLHVNSTPQLFLYLDGHPINLHVEQSLKKMAETSPDKVHDAVLSDIIQKIRLKAEIGSEDD